MKYIFGGEFTAISIGDEKISERNVRLYSYYLKLEVVKCIKYR